MKTVGISDTSCINNAMNSRYFGIWRGLMSFLGIEKNYANLLLIFSESSTSSLIYCSVFLCFTLLDPCIITNSDYLINLLFYRIIYPKISILVIIFFLLKVVRLIIFVLTLLFHHCLYCWGTCFIVVFHIIRIIFNNIIHSSKFLI